MSINFNDRPYFDDFDESKKFQKILFRPGFAVQTRELNQIQSILQNQLSKVGDHLFKDGSMVIPGQVSTDTSAISLKLKPQFQDVDLEIYLKSFIGTVIEGQSSGTKAYVVDAISATETDPITLILRATQTGLNGTDLFLPDEIITSTDNVMTLSVENATGEFKEDDKITQSGASGVILNYNEATGKLRVQLISGQFIASDSLLVFNTLEDKNGVKASLKVVGVDNVEYANQQLNAVVATNNPVSPASVSFIKTGIYYINKQFVRVEAQTLVLEKYSNTPSYRIGLNVEDIIVTPELDQTLLDNANGSFNFTAPGAHRYKIDLVLTKKLISETTDNKFIELQRIENGVLLYETRSTEYSVLEQTLARRTFDESGNYAIRPFPIEVREHRNNDRGQWKTGTQYLRGDIVVNAGKNYTALTTSAISGNNPPVHTIGAVSDGSVTWVFTEKPEYNRGIFTPENGGDDNKLSLNIQPGKAYVAGYEIEKIASEYVTIDKARDFDFINSDAITTNVGSYVLVNNVSGVPNFTQFERIDLYDRFTSSLGSPAGTKIGTARIRQVSFDSGIIGTASARYKVSIFDVQINNGKTFERDVKQLYLNNAVDADYTADVLPVAIQLSGSVTSSGTTVSGSGTLFLRELKVGDYIDISGSRRRIVSIVDNVSLTIDQALTQSASVVFFRLQTQIVDSGLIPLVYPLGKQYVRKVRGQNDIDLETSYAVTQRFDVSTNGSGVATISINSVTTGHTTTTGSEFDPSAQESDFIIINKTTGQYLDAGVITITETSVTINGLPTNTPIVVYATVIKQNQQAREKIKTLVIASTVTYTTQSAVQNPIISLGKADAIKIQKIEMSDAFGTFNPANATDITTWYDFDDGQRSTHYEVSRIVRKPNFPSPTGSIRIIFDYFNHSAGDYFSVDSYVDVAYKDIPVLNTNELTVSLADVLDFRPRISDNGQSFIATGSSLAQLPARGTITRADYSFFLGRKDRIALSQFGRYFIVSGKSAEVPLLPEEPSFGMNLHNITFSPFTLSTNSNDVLIESIDNKRFTMRDIGKLEKRIDNLEYYTSLSLLEQETQSLQIQDETGLDRFKNGFIVDNFTSQALVDVNSPDFKTSFDIENQECRPTFSMGNVNLIEENSTNIERTVDNYRITGDIITLPYTEIPFIVQPYSTRTENINPFAVFSFAGRVDLNPQSDEWFETLRRPDIVINQEGNFSAIRTLAEEAGVLGTVWNSWQTQWTGSPRVVGSGTRSLGVRDGSFINDGINFGIQRIETTQSFNVIATNIGQSRTGINTNIVARVDRSTIDDRVVSTAIIPFIRSRDLRFKGERIRPNTRVYPYFDGIRVDSFVKPADRLSVSSVGTFSFEFDSESNSGENIDTATRQRTSNVVELAYNKGDVIYVKQRGSTVYDNEFTSPATAVLALYEKSVTNINVLNVLNRKGNFLPGDILEGTISKARGTLTTQTLSNIGDPLVTNFAGDIAGTFTIPQNDQLRFRTGVREFSLSSSETRAVGDTFAVGNYRAEGTLETRQSTILAVRNAQLVETSVSQERVITQTTERVVGTSERVVGYYDPIAQTFFVQQAGGVFLTSVDIFFATKDESIPVELQIRDVVNGYPGGRILPFSRTIKPAADVSISDDSTVATRFTFESPVYLSHATEYCIVLLSDSVEYRVWISQLGEKSIGEDRVVSEQPHLGVLFKSQNNTTWSADQLQDLKFTLNRATFATNVEGVVSFVNQTNPLDLLEPLPFTTTNGSGIIRVFHRNHGMSDGGRVTISGSTDLFNIPAALINTTHTVNNVEFDSYTITVSTSANRSGNTGGNNVMSTKDVQFTSIQPIIQTQSFDNTRILYDVSTTSSQTVNGGQTPYLLDLTGVPVVVNDTNNFTSPRVIASKINENGVTLGGQKSFKLTARILSTQENLSPIIDTARCSVITINNRISNNTFDNTHVSPIDDIIIANNVAGFVFNGNTITYPSTIDAVVPNVISGKYIVITGTANNNGTFLVTNIDLLTRVITVSGSFTSVTTNASITLRNRFIDELGALGGSQDAKYVTRVINLQNPSTFLRVQFAYNIPVSADIDVYYKTLPVNSVGLIDDLNYVKASPTSELRKTSNAGLFGDSLFEIDDITPFNQVVVKVVFRSVNSAEVPRIKDFRVIACA